MAGGVGGATRGPTPAVAGLRHDAGIAEAEVAAPVAHLQRLLAALVDPGVRVALVRGGKRRAVRPLLPGKE